MGTSQAINKKHSEQVIATIKNNRKLKRRNDHLTIFVFFIFILSLGYLNYKIDLIGDEQKKRTPVIEHIKSKH